MTRLIASLRIFWVLVVLCLAQAGWWIYFQVHEARVSRDQRVQALEVRRQLAESLLHDVRAIDRAAWLSQEFPDLQQAGDGRIAIREESLRAVEDESSGRVVMFLSEGGFFVLLIVSGMWVIYSALRREAELQARQNNFILSVTHEFKSPLASLKLYLQTMQSRTVSPERQQGFLENGLADIDRLQTLIDNVLAASRIDQKSTWKMEPINLSEIAINTLKKPLYVQSADRLKTDIDEACWLLGDSVALYSVLDNLVENALKYSKDQVIVSVSKNHEWVELRVADQGPGIPPKFRRLIFEKFYRVGEEMTRETRGTGLGLYLVDQITRALGGNIRVESQSGGRGTAFAIQFPLWRVQP